MYFTILIAGILIYSWCSKLDNRQGKNFLLWYSPILVAMFLTLAFQYNVGTDYFNYIEMTGNDATGLRKLNELIADKEYLFALFVKLAQITNYPQLLFILTAAVQTITFTLALQQLRARDCSVTLILFLYFTLCVSFFNQFNTMRQFISVNILFLAIVLLLNTQKLVPWPLCVSLLAPFFHRTSWIMVLFIILFYLLRNKIKFNNRILIIGSILCAALYLVDINALIAWISQATGQFTEYIGNKYVEKLPLLNIATRLAKLVVVYYCYWNLRKVKLSADEHKLLVLSELAVFMMLISFSSTLLWRIYLYVDILLIFPAMLFYKYEPNRTKKLVVAAYLAAMLLAKILLFPSGEYLYQSVFTA